MSSSHKMLTGLLREEMGFDGVCAADYGAVGNVFHVQKVGESVTEAGLMCMEAGMDVEMQNCVGFNEELKEWFRSGRANMEILDRAVRRILEAKFRMGIFEHPYALENEALQEAFYRKEDEGHTAAGGVRISDSSEKQWRIAIQSKRPENSSGGLPCTKCQMFLRRIYAYQYDGSGTCCG